MTKAGTDDWKTPLGYYERAIAELRRAREEIQTELQNIKATQASQVELKTLKVELQSSQTELQAIKAELQTTKECLAITQQTADETQARVTTAEKAANDAHAELQNMKPFMINQLNVNNNQIIKELSQLKEQLSQFQQFRQPHISEENDFKTQTLQSLSNLHSQVAKLADELTLISSASGANYTQLRNLLAVGEWKKADRETHVLMCRISNRDREGWYWLDRAEIERFPWQDFRIINRLWLDYSKGRFGFSVQKQMWQSIKVTNNNDFEAEKSFGDRVGWRVNNNWLKYDNLTFDINASEGHLPSTLHLLNMNVGRVEDRVRFLFSRRDLQA